MVLATGNVSSSSYKIFWQICLEFFQFGCSWSAWWAACSTSWLGWALVSRPLAQLLCSIEKAVWKLGQNGLSTEAKIYYYRFVYTSTFFSNGRISETKQDFLNALVPKFSYRRGLSSTLSWKWPRPTLSSSFGLFLERKHIFGVFQVGQIGPLRFKTCPWDPYWWWRKKIYGAS